MTPRQREAKPSGNLDLTGLTQALGLHSWRQILAYQKAITRHQGFWLTHSWQGCLWCVCCPPSLFPIAF